MKLFAVIHTVGGFAREDAANPAIAGIFTDEAVADSICKAVGVGAKVVPVEVDKIAPGYLNFAKEVLNVDLTQVMKDKEDGLKEFSELDRECLMDAKQFMEDADSGFLTNNDGSGYWATESKVSRISCWKEQPEWATHVCWYNK